MKKREVSEKEIEHVRERHPNTDDDRRRRAQKKKKGSAGKVFLGVIGVLVLLAAVFVITVKVMNPDADLSHLIPVIPREKAVQFIDEKLLGKTTTAATTTATTATTTTQPTTTEVRALYLPIEEFAFKTAVQGNQVGNILAGGKVATDMTYIYHIVDGRGIYRFAPSTEGYYRIYKTENKLSSLNLRGEYLYFIDDATHQLFRLKKSEQKPTKIGDNVTLAYVYDTELFYVTMDNQLGVMNLKDLKGRLVFDEATPDSVGFLGISLNAVFFTLTAGDGTVAYMSVPKAGGEAVPFRNASDSGTVKSPVLENGFLYYYERQDDLSYNLCRQKFGSKKVVTLLENVSAFLPPIVENNRLFFGEYDNGRFRMKELNMNSGAVKTMLYAKNAAEDNALIIQHGGEYDFIIGKKNDKERVYLASSAYTGSSNIMHFEDGGWSY